MSRSTKKLDLTNQQFGRLTVLRPADNIGCHTAWVCQCECGRKTVVVTRRLRSGNTKSCGCIRGGDFPLSAPMIKCKKTPRKKCRNVAERREKDRLPIGRIRSGRQKGLSYTELGKKHHMDPRTAKRYAESPQKPEYTLTWPKPTKLDPYKQKIDQWLKEAPYSTVRILEKLQEEGFDGKYSIVKEYVRGKKMDLEEKATVRFETMSGKQGQMDWGWNPFLAV